MDEPRTPDHVLSEIRATRADLLRGSSALYDAEVAAETAELAAQKVEDVSFLGADGAVEARKAQARIDGAEAALDAAVARAQHNRVRAKIRALESSLMSLQAELKFMREEGA